MDFETEAIPTIEAIIKRCGMTYTGLAPFVGVSATTLRHALATGILPDRYNARRAIVDFACRNANAKSRAELRIV